MMIQGSSGLPGLWIFDRRLNLARHPGLSQWRQMGLSQWRPVGDEPTCISQLTPTNTSCIAAVTPGTAKTPSQASPESQEDLLQGGDIQKKNGEDEGLY